jgi:ribosomal protein RSM22 (predicted rRNA methylase)
LAGALPANLTAAIAAMLDGVSRKNLAARAARLSKAYRDGSASTLAVVGADDVLAYLLTRMPATSAATAAVFRHLQTSAPEFAPRSLLDVGAGPGTASFAAVEAWPGICAVTAIDSNRHFVNAAAELAAASGHAALIGSNRILADATGLGRDLPRSDLVVAAYALAQIDASEAGAFVASLWKATAGALAIVEPGTPAGFQRIREARSALVAAGAAIAAPCPHALPCPIVAPDWCHFSERLARSRDHKLAKGADAPFEDEKYSYVVAARPSIEVASRPARILARPQASKAGIRLKLCRADGMLAERIVPRRDRAKFATIRRARWGDTFDGYSGSQGVGDS